MVHDWIPFFTMHAVRSILESGVNLVNARGAEILINPHPCGNIVYPYIDKGLVGQTNAHVRRGLNSCGPPVTLRSAKHGRETWLG